MTVEKINFLKNEFIGKLNNLSSDSKGKWGKMNAQQMVEHITGFFLVSTGKLNIPLITPPEHLQKLKEFLLSEKEFRENTKAPLEILSEEPLPLRSASMLEAINELAKSVHYFFLYYEQNTSHKKIHPVFGELNFLEWVQLHHKHVVHHLKQFGLT